MLWYSKYDLIGGIRRNGGSRNYIQILADINCCEVYHIEAELKKLGCTKVKGKWVPPRIEPSVIIAKAEWKAQQSRLEGSILDHSICVQIMSENQINEGI